MTEIFSRFDAADVRDLIAEYPLAWVTASGGGDRVAEASLLPLLGDYGEDGHLVGLVGHLARRNPLHARLLADPAATVLFTGPQGHVSVTQAGARDRGPTWNYAQLTIAADIVFEPERTEAAIARLVTATEGTGWTAAELGSRYDGMVRAVIAFRARVTGLVGRFKLGQDEPRPVFDAIVRSHPDAALVRWMRRFDRGKQG